MINLFQLGLLAVSTPLTFLWIYFAAFTGKKYKSYIQSEFAREFPVNELLCVGFSLMEMLHIHTKSRRAQAKIKEIAEIRGKNMQSITIISGWELYLHMVIRFL